MLDFNRLRNQVDGHRGAFEGLVRQLASLEYLNTNAHFQHIHGAGGDGGIEAYWVFEDGNEHGYQCKFHTRSGDIDWGALDASIEAALISHPKLTHITVAIACDLTDVVPGRGKSGREKWNARVEKWKSNAAQQSRNIEFSFWGESEIESLLTKPDARGIREYWFGEIQLDIPWLNAQFEQTIAMLEERYSPDDHVEVGTRKAFDGLLRSSTWQRKFRDAVNTLINVVERPIDKEGVPYIQKFDEMISVVENVNARVSDFHLPPHTKFPTDEWREIINNLVTKSEQLDDSIFSEEHNDGKTHSLESVRHLANLIRQAVYDLDDFLSSPMQTADETRSVIFQGPAGSGKSHLLASEVANVLNEGAPAIMLLGTQFSRGSSIQEQILKILGFDKTFETFLGALDAAAEANGTRALIVIDAINEGNIPDLWRNELPALITRITRHPRLSLATSCRSEYAPFHITAGAQSSSALVYVRGFSSPREQERAAQVYMDRRGIRRPATPLLSPEFSNPLFLRSTCIALEKDGRDQYPSGLRGLSETLAFYLKAMGRHLGTQYDGSDELVNPLKRAVNSLAGNMASNCTDFIAKHNAISILETQFASYSFNGADFLDRLRKAGLLRFDPHPDQLNNDPLSPPEDVVRFAFQRFQDYLIAKHLVQNATLDEAVFKKDGDFAFLLENKSLSYKWIGVFQAVWTISAETHGIELCDLLAEEDTSRLHISQINAAFLESVYWRAPSAFTDRTLEIFNAWNTNPVTLLTIVLRFCVLEHPWNAERLDLNLQSRSLSERDAFWTSSINNLVGDEDELSTPEWLIEWCSSPSLEHASDVSLTLALTTLGWLFSSTNGYLRDRATKAAIEVLLDRPNLTPGFVKRFAKVNDPYVIERVLGACAGSCLRDPSPERLKIASDSVFNEIFVAGCIPTHLLARDYARTIIDLATDHNVLSDGIDISLCHPPYKTTKPNLTLNSDEVEKLAEGAGANQILSSCTGWVGDFGRYIIQSRMRNWSSIPLSEPKPMKPKQWGDDKNKIDVEAAKWWVVNRTLELGWNNEMFPNDRSLGGASMHGAKIERVGKKYQWIAYHELMARLADNFWLVDEYHELYAQAYSTPIDTSFVRDIELTIPAHSDQKNDLIACSPPRVQIERVEYTNKNDWVFEPDFAKARMKASYCNPTGHVDDWLTLHQYTSNRIKRAARDQGASHDTYQEEFFFVTMVAVRKSERARIIRRASELDTDFHEWRPRERTDEGYVYELGLRNTWRDYGFRTETNYPNEEDFEFRDMAVGYRWESHLDGSLPNGASVTLPSPWLVDKLGLKFDAKKFGIFQDKSQEIIAASCDDDDNDWCIAKREPVFKLLEENDLSPLWVGIGERSIYPEAQFHGVTRIRWNGILWLTKAGIRSKFWDERHDVNPLKTE